MKGNGMIRNIIMLAVMLMTTFALSGCGAKSVDLKECVSIETSGADGYGTLSVSLKGEELYTKVVGDSDKKNSLEDLEDVSDLLDSAKNATAFSGMTCSADKTENLKNGDVVTIKVENFEKVEEAYEVSFENTEFTYTVEGLSAVSEVDPWADVSLNCDGSLEEGYSLSIEKNDTYDEYIQYDIEDHGTISSGSAITVTYSADEEDMLENGYAIKKDAEKSKQFIISGVDGYVQDFSEITDAALSEMKTKGVSLIKATYFGENGSYSGIKDVLSNKKNLDYGWEDAKGKLKSQVSYEHAYFKKTDGGNIVRLMFSFKVKDRKTSATMHAIVQYNNVIQKNSGDIYVKYEGDYDGNYSIPYLDTSVKDIENEVVINNEYVKAE